MGNSTDTISIPVFCLCIAVISLPTVFTSIHLSKKAKTAVIAVFGSIGGIIAMYVLYINKQNINIMKILFFFVAVLGILLVILSSTSSVEPFSGDGKGLGTDTDGYNEMGTRYIRSDRSKLTDSPIIRQDGSVCIVHDKDNYYYSTTKDNVCVPDNSKYGSLIDGIEDDADADAPVDDMGLGLGAIALKSQADLDDELAATKAATAKMIADGKCIKDVPEANCQNIKDSVDEITGADIDNYNVVYNANNDTHEKLYKYLTKKCSKNDHTSGAGNIKRCCSTDDNLGNHTIKYSCVRGSFGSKRFGTPYTTEELNSMTTCLPVTNDFNNECTNVKGYCSYNTEAVCNKSPICGWEDSKCNLKYNRADFGYKQLLNGYDGGCIDNTYGRAICSPNYFDGIQNVVNSTYCLDDSTGDFKTDCNSIYNGTQSGVGDSISVGCNPSRTRKICNK
jgi:hypothetical protein